MTQGSRSQRDWLALRIFEHSLASENGDPDECKCGWTAPDDMDHMDHVADELMKRGVLTSFQHGRVVQELTTAIQHTVEYAGFEVHQPHEGWSWYDAMRKYAPGILDQMLNPVRPQVDFADQAEVPR